MSGGVLILVFTRKDRSLPDISQLGYQSIKKQPPNNRIIIRNCLHQIPSWDAVRGPNVGRTSLEETVKRPVLRITAVPPWQDMSTSWLSFSSHFHRDRWVSASFFRRGTAAPEDHTASWNNHRWSRELMCWVCPFHQCYRPQQQAPQQGQGSMSHLQCKYLNLQGIMQAPTVPQDSKWFLGKIFAHLNGRQSPAQCSFTGVELSWWCLCPCPIKCISRIFFGMGITAEMQRRSGSLSASSSVHLPVDTRSQSTLSFRKARLSLQWERARSLFP